uniref:ATP synthase CF1 delta subunit n=1 Tax=Porphyridium sordidum TaxID=28024 RepID=A0A1C9CDZ4_PORSO|nr:ATP synthase CF1 delta subunit [Porphyridium sordidum]AOM66564.1 ATP synthase CF1 delta subunit [Porphyridium sordidum]
MSDKKISSKIAQPYAEALIELAIAKKELEEVTQDIKNINTTISENNDLVTVLKNPLIANVKKKQIVESIFKDTVNKTTLDFIKLIIDRNRVILLSKICEEFIKISYRKAGITIANVVTSIPFTEKQYNLLISKIKALTNSQQVEIKVEVDEDLIGGFTIQLGSRVIDSSLKGQLQQMATYLNR